MALIQAIASSPRIARTKFGDKTVLDCRLESGETITIWKEANNPQLMSVANGERLVLNSIEKHQGGYTYEIRETFRSRNDDQKAARETAQLNRINAVPERPMGFSVDSPIKPEQIESVQKSITLPVVDSIEQTIDAQLDQYSSVFKMCLARAEILSPSNSEALALEMFKGLASKLAA